MDIKTECSRNEILYKGKTYPCTVSLTMSLVGGKWKAVLLYHLMQGPRRYSELHREIPAVTEMTMSLQLKQLENDGIIQRTVTGTKPPLMVTYRLTTMGETLIPLLNAITNWGNGLIENDKG